jgi:hypothetical protein
MSESEFNTVLELIPLLIGTAADNESRSTITTLLVSLVEVDRSFTVFITPYLEYFTSWLQGAVEQQAGSERIISLLLQLVFSMDLGPSDLSQTLLSCALSALFSGTSSLFSRVFSLCLEFITSTIWLTLDLRMLASIKIARVFELTPVELNRLRINPGLLTQARECLQNLVSEELFGCIESRFPNRYQHLCQLFV